MRCPFYLTGAAGRYGTDPSMTLRSRSAFCSTYVKKAKAGASLIIPLIHTFSTRCSHGHQLGPVPNSVAGDSVNAVITLAKS
jgi:hypothetical protein